MLLSRTSDMVIVTDVIVASTAYAAFGYYSTLIASCLWPPIASCLIEVSCLREVMLVMAVFPTTSPKVVVDENEESIIVDAIWGSYRCKRMINKCLK